MNAKLCKSLRRAARKTGAGSDTTYLSKKYPNGLETFSVDPVCVRGVYLSLKKEFRK